MAQFFFILPGETLSAAKQAALTAAGVQVVEASLPPAPPSGSVYVLGSPQATETNGVWSQNWVLQSLPTPTLQQSAAALLRAGTFQVQSSSTAALSGTYACDTATNNRVLAELVSILTNGSFTNGEGTRTWPQAGGAEPSFTIAQFRAFATAMGDWIDALDLAATTGGGSIPTQPSVIP
jgi:hypothetical protein